MQTQALSSEAKDDGKSHQSAKNIVALIIVGLCFSSIVGLYILAKTSRYIVLSIPPPEDSYDLVGWGSTTKSVVTTPGNTNYIWREDTTLAYESYDNIPSWNALSKHFEERLSQIGWKQSDTSRPCDIYLPEAAFLEYGENGFVTYHRVDDTDDIPMGDAICLAIWNDEGDPNVFRIVLLTIKRSFRTNFYRIFE